MDLAATQVYEDDDFLFTQKISHALEEEESVQVGTLSINSTDYPIKKGITKIGRFGSCDIVINDVTVSKLHAEIEASGGQGSTWLSDLNSSNKTKLNNLTLQVARSYELKDGSVIEFGRVRATYRTYCPTDDSMIPETPAPSRQKTANIIIPNTPDSSLNNSSSVDGDGSIIFGTQKDDENSVFRRPQIPQQCQSSTSVGKKKTSMNESNDSRIATLRTSDTNVSESRTSIYDLETQTFEEGCKTTSNSIYDMETQVGPIDISERVVDANATKQMPKLNVSDKTAGRSVTDIHDVEMQNYIDDINEMETQKSNLNIRNVTEKKIDIRVTETQSYVDDTVKDDSNVQKSEIDKNNGRQKSSADIERSIHDLETQKYIAEDISDLETQLELNSIATSEQNRDISDMETQLEANVMVDKTSNNQVNKDKNKNGAESTSNCEDGINREDITKSPRSRSDSPASLNLSSPGVEGDPSSPLNQSGHLLESSDLLEFFSEGIEKQGEAQAPNASTPKPSTKISERDSNVENERNVVNDEENNDDDDDDIFETPTQRNFEALMSDSETDEKDVPVMRKVSKKKHGKPQSEKNNDDSETDAEEYVAELAKKPCTSPKTLNKPSTEDVSNKNDPGTSIESEDMFDAPTQRLDDCRTIKASTNSSTNQAENANEINEAEIDYMAPTQIIRDVDQGNQTCTSKKNQNVDDVANTQIINTKSIDCTTENLDCEDIDYELAPTQVISEIKNKEKNSISKTGSTRVNLNDTVERELNEMFDDVNDINNSHESPLMSTQCLENLLESSQCDDSANKTIAGVRDTGSVLQKQIQKKNRASFNQHSHNLPSTEVNANATNKAETDSQDVYFSTITTRRKRNIIRDTQEFADSVENTTPHQDVNSSQASKANNKKAMDDNVAVESDKRRKRIPKNKSDAITETLNDNSRNEIISSEKNERSLRSSKRKDEAPSERSKQILGSNQAKIGVDDAEENTPICTPCPLENGQRLQTLYENDDDILMRLPAVRMSGTLSNPASPSASSTSTVRSTSSKRDAARSKAKKNTASRGKSLRKRDTENSEKNGPSGSHSNFVLGTLMTDKMPTLVDTSGDSDSETERKRFHQMAGRMFNNKLSCPKQQDEENEESARISPNLSEHSKQNMDVESKNSVRTSSRIKRHSSKQNDESSRDFQKETCIKNTASGAARSTKLETKSVIAKRKVSQNVTEKSEQVTSKKRKTAQATEECPVSTRDRGNTMKTATDRQSPNILQFTKMNSCENSSTNMKFLEDNKAASKTTLQETHEISLNTGTDGNVGSGRANVKRTRRIIYDNQVTTHVNDEKKNELAEIKRTETQVVQSQDKVLRVLLSPIKSPADDASQEVERIMARGPSNAQDKNLSIRESNKAKIFQRQLRTRSRKRPGSDTDSVLTESSVSSGIDSDNTQLDNFAPKAKRGRYAISSVSSLPEAQISKKETFKKPTRINQNSTGSILDSSIGSTTGESSQSSTGSDASTSSRFSRSKAASMKKKQKIESNQNRLIDESASKLNASVEVPSPVSTPSRTRRSTSILNTSTSSAMRHKVLFTGLTEDYNKLIKTLGGIKVEDPAKCTVLVTDKVRRTYKFLCALAKGVPIVAIDWLKDSETAERFLDWENYILKDPAAEAKFGFRLRKSLDKAKEKKLLDGYIVVLTPSVAPPPIEELKHIIASCGGKALLRPPTKWPERAIVLSREEDLSNARKFLAKAPNTVTVQSTEFILTGILRQETDFVKYKLT